jgi:hippurate hydrolase
LDGIARIAKGEAIAAGVPEDRMPVVTARNDHTPATLNTQPLTGQIMQAFAARFGPERVRTMKPQMGGEDFSRYRLVDPSIQSLLFWVGAVPQDKWDAAGGDLAKLPSIHSPFWAPDPAPTIAAATEAMVTAALTVLGRK